MAKSSFLRKRSDEIVPPEEHSSAGESVGSSFASGSMIPQTAEHASSRVAMGNEEDFPAAGEQTVISKHPPERPSNQRSGSPLEWGRNLEGTKLGHYQLETFVGGGMGAVFRAHDEVLGRTVAVKVLSAELNDNETIRRFRNEAQSTARLNHENIARVYHVGSDDGWHYIVFEFIEGLNIRQLVEMRGPLPLAEALSYVLDAAEALAHAQQRDVVHRDIKPSNLIVTPAGKATLVDMGLARLHQVESSSDDLTASGVTLGTFDYISPEQARDPRMADVRSDLYSLGCTLFFMLAGRPPFPEGTVLQKLISHSADAPPNVCELRPELPYELTHLLGRMLVKRPDDRYQNPQELIAAIILFAEEIQLTLPSSARQVVLTAAPPHLTIWERHLPWLAPVVLLIAAAFGLELFTGNSSDSSEASWAASPLELRLKENAPGDSSVLPKGGEKAAAPVAIPPRGEAAASSPATADSSANPSPPETSKSRSDSAPPPGDAQEEPSLQTPKKNKDNATSSLPLVSSEIDVATAAGMAKKDDASANVALPVGQRVIVVGRVAGNDPEDTLAFETLEAAVAAAARHADIKDIELRYDGVHLENPLTIALDRSLTVSAGAGYSPAISFAPRVEDLAPHGMISLAGSQISFRGLDFQLLVPTTPSEDWSLFQLLEVESLLMEDCSMTIINLDEYGAPVANRAAFFAHAAGPAESSMPTEAETTLAHTTIALSRCIARGQATLVFAAEAKPLTFSWSQGLFVTTERLLHLRGVKSSRPLSDPVELDLRHITASMQGGLCLVESTEMASYLLPLNVRCQSSILITQAGAPLIEHVCWDTLENLRDKTFRFTGDFNFYPKTSLFRSIRSNSQEEPALEWDRENWTNNSDDVMPYIQVLWNNGELPVDVPVELQTVDDYLLKPDMTNRAYRPESVEGSSGFDAEQLPRWKAG